MLGLYAIAFNIANFGADYFGTKVQRVVFPAYSNMQDNMNNLRAAMLKVFKYMSIFTLPLGMTLFLLSEEVLISIYGPKWIGAAGVLRILAWAGIFNTLPASLNAGFMACNKPRLTFWIT